MKYNSLISKSIYSFILFVNLSLLLAQINVFDELITFNITLGAIYFDIILIASIALFIVISFSIFINKLLNNKLNKNNIRSIIYAQNFLKTGLVFLPFLLLIIKFQLKTVNLNFFAQQNWFLNLIILLTIWVNIILLVSFVLMFFIKKTYKSIDTRKMYTFETELLDSFVDTIYLQENNLEVPVKSISDLNKFKVNQIQQEFINESFIKNQKIINQVKWTTLPDPNFYL